MNLVNKLLLVTFVFGITRHDVASTNQGIKQGQPCKTSEQCLVATSNSECDSETKKCICATGYGIDGEESYNIDRKVNCAEYPFRKRKFAKFEADAHLICSISHSNITEIFWNRNNRDLCTDGSYWCSKYKITRSSVNYPITERTMTLSRVIRNANYTCVVTTSDGKNLTVSETEVVVDPNRESLTNLTYGGNHHIDCIVRKYNLQVRLVRNDNESCTPDATWCSEKKPTLGGSSRSFDVLDLQTNQTFKCEAFVGDEHLATVSIHKFQVGLTPNIHNITLSSPANLPVWKGSEVVVTARFYSPTGITSRRWYINDGHTSMVGNDDELSILSGNEYESKVSFGPIYLSSDVSLTVGNIYGNDMKTIQVNVDTKNAVTKYASYGSDYLMECDQMPDMKIRLLRDGDRNTDWYAIENEKKYPWGTSTVFRVINLTDNHTYTCETYDEKNVTTTMIQRIIIVPKPKILQIEFSPPGPTYPRQTERIVATARFQWSIISAGELVRGWKTDVQNTEWPYNDKVEIKDELRFISGNEYESKATIGPVARTGDISFEIRGFFGRDEKTIRVVATAQYGEDCRSGINNVLCQPNTTTCSWRSDKCLCPDGLVWDLSACRPSVNFGESCESSAQCHRDATNSECNPEEKRCLCPPNYGMDNLKNVPGWYSHRYNCQQYPFQKEDVHVEFEMDYVLDCNVHISNFLKIMWIRNDKDICTSDSTWCFQEETESRANENMYYSRMKLKKLTSTGTYACQAINRNGSKVTIFKRNVIVDPILVQTTYTSRGSDSTIHCSVETSRYYEINLVRNDSKTTCTSGATWCSQRNTSTTTSSSRFFDILDLQSDQTYNCEAYMGNNRIGTVSIHHFLVGDRPKILDLTLSPAGSQRKGAVVVATVHFQSKTTENLFRRWTIYNGIHIKDLQDQLSGPFQNRYDSTVTFGPLDRASILRFEVGNGYGYDRKNVSVGVPHGKICNSAVMCTTENTECDKKSNSCQCRTGYLWNSSTSICLKNSKFGEPCDSTTRCETYNTECDMKSGLCLCHTGYHWEEPNCQKN